MDIHNLHSPYIQHLLLESSIQKKKTLKSQLLQNQLFMMSNSWFGYGLIHSNIGLIIRRESSILKRFSRSQTYCRTRFSTLSNTWLYTGCRDMSSGAYCRAVVGKHSLIRIWLCSGFLFFASHPQGCISFCWWHRGAGCAMWAASSLLPPSPVRRLKKVQMP